jgi:hypothetical protein
MQSSLRYLGILTFQIILHKHVPLLLEENNKHSDWAAIRLLQIGRLLGLLIKLLAIYIHSWDMLHGYELLRWFLHYV